MEPKVGIVLVNYNGEKFQNDCIRTIKQMTYNNYEIIVVDNDSKDKSVELLKNEFPEVNLIETGENAGVAKGNNIGIKAAIKLNCEYILLLNNDTEVDLNMLTVMIQKADKNKLVTCKMYYYEPNTMLWYAGGKINWNKATTTHFGEDEIDCGQYDESKYVEYTPTCCLLIHKSVFDEVGLMDEKYFMYYDDTDFIARCNKKGYKIWYEAGAKLWHKVSSSSGGKQSKTVMYYSNRNRLYFINKFYKNKFWVMIYFYVTRIIRYMQANRKVKSILKKSIDDYKDNKMYRQDLI